MLCFKPKLTQDAQCLELTEAALLFEYFLEGNGETPLPTLQGVLKCFRAHSVEATSVYLHHFEITYSKHWTQSVSPGLYHP